MLVREYPPAFIYWRLQEWRMAEHNKHLEWFGVTSKSCLNTFVCLCFWPNKSAVFKSPLSWGCPGRSWCEICFVLAHLSYCWSVKREEAADVQPTSHVTSSVKTMSKTPAGAPRQGNGVPPPTTKSWQSANTAGQFISSFGATKNMHLLLMNIHLYVLRTPNICNNNLFRPKVR